MTPGNEESTNVTRREKQDEGQTVPFVEGDSGEQHPGASVRGITTVVAATGHESHPLPRSTLAPSQAIPSSFQPYDGSEDFTDWLRTLDYYVADVAEGERSRLLLRHLGPRQLRQALNSGATNDMEYTELSEQLRNLFAPQPWIGQRISKFLNRHQQPGETPRQFAADLLRLCYDAYRSLEPSDAEDVTLYHFIIGLSSRTLSENLMLQPPLLLEEALERADRFLSLERNRHP